MPETPGAGIAPISIAAGVASAHRRDICAMLAVFDASAPLEMIRDAAGKLARRHTSPDRPDTDRLDQRREELRLSVTPTDTLRLALWRRLREGLDRTGPEPLSMRKVAEAANALGYAAAVELSADAYDAKDKGVWTRMSDGVAAAWNDPSSLLRASTPLSFPEVVGRELGRTLDAARTVDPACADALRKASAHLALGGAAGGAWIGAATAIGGAGFAPYMAAAQVSAWLPLVSGPMLTSALAVMVSPPVLLLGLGVGGWMAVDGVKSRVRRKIAARTVVALALAGLAEPDAGARRFLELLRRMGDDPDIAARRAAIARRMSPATPLRGTFREGRPEASDGYAAVAATGGLTAADMLDSAAAIEPSVLAAADFCRKASLDDPLDLAAGIDIWATEGSRIGLRGYVAEQLVMTRLIENGHAVELATSSNTAGFDLLVDGLPVQVKCGKGLGLLREHFERYPDIPVVSDADLACQAAASDAPWADLVTTVEGFDIATVEQAVSETLDAAQDLAAPDVALAAIAVGAIRSACKVWSGAIPIQDLPADLAFDAGLRGLLSTAGGKAGAAVGLLAIGPAGALILGPMAGVASQMAVNPAREQVERAMFAEWRAEVDVAAGELHAALVDVLERRIDRLTRQGRQDDRSLDDVTAAAESLLDLTRPATTQEAAQFMIEATHLAPTDVRTLRARAVLRRALEGKPGLTDTLSVKARQGWDWLGRT